MREKRKKRGVCCLIQGNVLGKTSECIGGVGLNSLAGVVETIGSMAVYGG